MSLFAELKRRNVVRVGIAYAIIGWVVAQIAEFAFENFGAPDWVLKTVVVILLLGLPIALFFAWAFELTPDGVKREKDVDRTASITPQTGQKLNYVIIAALVFAVGYFVWERQADDVPVEATKPAAVTDTAQEVSDDSKSRSIAVLPFVNMSSDKEQEWFSDGLTEEILNALARTPDLLVAARTSSFKFKGSTEDIPTIAKSLGVAHVLEGSVRSGGENLRVTAQLIRANDGFHLWSETYDRKPEDIIGIQEDIAIKIATALETVMDPEALAKMVSTGTSSVAAFNAYIQGLAYGASTASSGDVYTFLGARDSYERAVQLDPAFSLAYWKLAEFWNVQLTATNIAAGIVELSKEEMNNRFDDAIDRAILTERDPINGLQYRALKAQKNLRFTKALRLNTEYLGHRPNDLTAQNEQLSLLADLSLDDQLAITIREYQERSGYDPIVSQTSMTFSLISDDPDLIREVTKSALERVQDNAVVNYQAHRALLWAGDIDGASRMAQRVAESDLGESSLQLIALRQACAENRISAARRIYERLQTQDSDSISTVWISHMIMDEREKAFDAMRALDQQADLRPVADFLSYAYFDARQFPNLMSLLDSQGIEPREPKEIPYRCRTNES